MVYYPIFSLYLHCLISIESMKYDLYQSPHSIGTDNPEYHARPVNENPVNFEKLVGLITDRCNLSPGEVLNMFATLEDVMVEQLSSGSSVQIKGLGTFQVSLSTPKLTKRRAPGHGIEVKKVNFRTEENLKKRINKKASFKRDTSVLHSRKVTVEDLATKILPLYYQKERFLTRKKLQEFAQLNESTASARIRELIKRRMIENVSGNSRSPLYVLCENKR